MKKMMRSSFAFSLFSLAIGLLAASVVAILVGEGPLQVISILIEGAFGSLTNLGYSLYYATPLILTGLSVSWAFRAGLFNIGAEGQMALGGLTMTWVGLSLSEQPPILVLIVALICAFFVGGIWGAIAGWMKAYRDAHEVLATILLNYVAYGIVSFFIAFPLRNVESQSPESRSLIPELKLTTLSFLGGQSPLNSAFIFSLAIAILAGLVLRKTIFGFRTRLVGEAPGTAVRSGVPIKKYTVLGMFIAGGFAGLAGINEIFGSSLKLHEGFMANAGFVGITVALLGRNSIVGIILSAILFGALQKGALALDMETDKITRDLALVIQAFIIFFIVSEKGLRTLLDHIQIRRGQNE